MSPIDLIPDEILAAFNGRSELSIRALAGAMGRDIQTLHKHREAGDLPVHIKGTGVERRHYVCTLHDVAEFYKRTGEQCQFSGSKTRPITSSTSRSKVIAFTAPRNARMNVRLVSSKTAAKRKPEE